MGAIDGRTEGAAGTRPEVPLETERKWMVDGWPQGRPDAGFPLLKEEIMRQGYVSVSPTVRIRSEKDTAGDTRYMLCFKSLGRMTRMEVEFPIPEDRFAQIEQLIGLPLIEKTRRTYQLPDGRHLEVNHVDAGLPGEFWYAEVEFGSEEEARAWDPEAAGLGAYLADDVTEKPGQSMGAYWAATRLGAAGTVSGVTGEGSEF